MLLKKKILLIALGMSFHGAVISMEEQTELEQELQATIITTIIHNSISMADCISDFARESAHDSEHMELLGRWLTIQRNTVTQADKWDTLIKGLTTNVAFCRCDCLANKTTAAVRDVVKDIANDLQPGQDCTQLLVKRAQGAVATAKLEWEIKVKKNPFDGMP